MRGSYFFSLSKYDWKKIGIGAAVAVVGALLTYFADLIPTIDFGPWTPIVTAGFAVLANVLRKWMMDTQEVDR